MRRPRATAPCAWMAAVLAAVGTASAAEPDPLETMPDRIDAVRIALPGSDRAAEILAETERLRARGRAVVAANAAGRETAAAAEAWSRITGMYATSGAPLTALNLFYETKPGGNLGAAMGDAGLLLALAQYNVDLRDPGGRTGNLAAGKSIAFWAAGRFGWRALSVSMGTVGVVDYLLDQLGRSSIRSRRLVLQSAFYNYHYPWGGEGWRTEKQWAEAFYTAKVRTREQACRVVRAHFELFWKKGPGAIRRYYMPAQVNAKANCLDKTLIALAGGAGEMSYTDADCRAVEDDFIRNYVVDAMETYFNVTLPLKIRRQAQAHAARRMKKVVAAINEVCTVRVTVANSAAAGGAVGVQFGPWKQRVGPDGSITFRFTRYAFLRHRVAPTVRLWMLDGDGRRTHVDKTIDNPVEKRNQAVTIRVPSDDGAAVTPPAPQDRVTVTLAMAFQPEKDIPEGWRVLRYPARHSPGQFRAQWRDVKGAKVLDQSFPITREPMNWDMNKMKFVDGKGNTWHAHGRCADVELELRGDLDDRQARGWLDTMPRRGGRFVDERKSIAVISYHGQQEVYFYRRGVWGKVSLSGPNSEDNPSRPDLEDVMHLARIVMRRIDAAG